MKRIVALVLLALVIAACTGTFDFDPVEPLPTANPIDMPTHVNAYNLIDPFGVIVTCQNRGVAVMEQYPKRILIVCAGLTFTPTAILTPTVASPTATATVTATAVAPTPTMTATAAPPANVISDPFNRANSTNLGAAWTERVGDWQIVTQAAAVITSTNLAHATMDTGMADGVISASVSSSGGFASEPTQVQRPSGLVVRYTDANNYWIIGINAGSDWFRIIERVNGTLFVRATVNVAIEPLIPYTITATLDGDNMSAVLDGGNEIFYNLATQGQESTVHGIVLRSSTDRADNFTVRE